jgi:hypothetical protein
MPDSYHPIVLSLHYPSILQSSFIPPPGAFNPMLIQIRSRITGAGVAIKSDVRGDPLLNIFMATNYRDFVEQGYDEVAITLISVAVFKHELVSDDYNRAVKVQEAVRVKNMPKVKFNCLYTDGLVPGLNTNKCVILYTILYDLIISGRSAFDVFLPCLPPLAVLVLLCDYTPLVCMALENIFHIPINAMRFNNAISLILGCISTSFQLSGKKINRLVNPIAIVQRSNIAWWDTGYTSYGVEYTDSPFLPVCHFDKAAATINNILLVSGLNG